MKVFLLKGIFLILIVGVLNVRIRFDKLLDNNSFESTLLESKVTSENLLTSSDNTNPVANTPQGSTNTLPLTATGTPNLTASNTLPLPVTTTQPVANIPSFIATNTLPVTVTTPPVTGTNLPLSPSSVANTLPVSVVNSPSLTPGNIPVLAATNTQPIAANNTPILTATNTLQGAISNTATASIMPTPNIISNNNPQVGLLDTVSNTKLGVTNAFPQIDQKSFNDIEIIMDRLNFHEDNSKLVKHLGLPNELKVDKQKFIADLTNYLNSLNLDSLKKMKKTFDNEGIAKFFDAVKNEVDIILQTGIIVFKNKQGGQPQTTPPSTTFSQNIPQAVQQNIPQAIQQNTPQAVQQNTPQAVQQNTPQASQQNTLQVVQQNAPQAVPQIAPQAVPQTAPQAVPQIAQTVPQIAQTVPQNIPQSAVSQNFALYGNQNSPLAPPKIPTQGAQTVTQQNSQNVVLQKSPITNPQNASLSIPQSNFIQQYQYPLQNASNQQTSGSIVQNQLPYPNPNKI
jgi:hypothetical protein